MIFWIRGSRDYRLLIKLRGLRFSHDVLSWILFYLANRTQAVVGEGADCSSWLSTSSVVLQGSVLSPHLFTLSIFDICSSLKYSQNMIFADDTNLPQLFAIWVGSRHWLNCLWRWSHRSLFTDNGLKLNLAKSKAIILGSRAFVSRIDTSTLPCISVDNTTLPHVSEVRNLGVVITCLGRIMSFPSPEGFILLCIAWNIVGISYRVNYDPRLLPP